MAVLEDDGQEQAAIHKLLSNCHINELREPKADEKVYKEDCVYCFRTPFFPGGIYVCLSRFVGVCEKHIVEYSHSTGSTVFLNIFHEKIVQESDEPKDKIARRDLTGNEFNKIYSVSAFPQIQVRIPIKPELLGDSLTRIVDSVIAHLSADVQLRVETGCDWEGAPLLYTPIVDHLVQLDVVKQESQNGWECEQPGCHLRNNLWFNLSDGVVMCGRGSQVMDGNYHAQNHARETGFRLVVRLGTIHNGIGEVYLYDFEEDKNEGFVHNPNLKQQMAHFGLDISTFTKSELNFVELEKSVQLKHDMNTIQEEGLNLVPKYGPGFTGLVNLGSSCYMNSVVQTLLNILDFVELYDKNAKMFFKSKDVLESLDDFDCQLAKLLHSMNSTEDFSKLDSKLNCIEPRRFKEVAGRGHPEFSTMKQQDVEQYIRYLCDIIDNSLPPHSNPVNAIRFKQFERFEDVASGHVRYNSHEDVILSVSIPNLKEVVYQNEGQEENVQNNKVEQRGKVTMAECIAKTFGDDFIEDYTSTITNERKGAKQTLRLGSFPDYLFVQLKRFTYDNEGNQKKLSVDVEDVDVLDLEALKTTGIQPGETELVESDGKEVVDNATVEQLMGMGFGENAVRKAIRSTNNMGVENAAHWLLAHAGDPGLNDSEPNTRISAKNDSSNSFSTAKVDESVVQKLVREFGFVRYKAVYALNQTNGHISDAINWLLENGDSVPAEETYRNEELGGSAESAELASETLKIRDGPGFYDLCGFISHIGSNPTCGHYVVHLKKDGVWYIYNDEKVCTSVQPPKKCGYVYLYKRRS